MVLYIFGIQQVISSMKLDGFLFLSVVGLIKVSWLTLNLLTVFFISKHRIYSNLNGENQAKQYNFQGKDNEVFLIGGNISERNYKDYLFIGNEEYINNDIQCNDLIDNLKLENNLIKKVVLSPFIPGVNMDKPYEKALLNSID